MQCKVSYFLGDFGLPFYFFYCIASFFHFTWGLLAPKPLGVFRYRLLYLSDTQKLQFYCELTHIPPAKLNILRHSNISEKVGKTY